MPLKELDPHAPVRLVVIKGQDVGLVFVVDQKARTIGRAQDADISVQGKGVSRYHARVERGLFGQVCVADLNSANGTYINEQPIKHGVLAPGDRLRLGVEVILHYECEQKDERDTVDLAVPDAASHEAASFENQASGVEDTWTHVQDLP